MKLDWNTPSRRAVFGILLLVIQWCSLLIFCYLLASECLKWKSNAAIRRIEVRRDQPWTPIKWSRGLIRRKYSFVFGAPGEEIESTRAATNLFHFGKMWCSLLVFRKVWKMETGWRPGLLPLLVNYLKKLDKLHFCRWLFLRKYSSKCRQVGEVRTWENVGHI